MSDAADLVPRIEALGDRLAEALAERQDLALKEAGLEDALQP